MKERPILFSGPMVRAVLRDQHTAIRRPMKHQPCRQPVMVPNGGANFWSNPLYIQGAMMGSQNHGCPYGQPGDRLWVREAWAQINVAQAPGESWVVYRDCDNRTDYGGPWKPSISMRRRDSRILLEVTDVRVERLRDADDMTLLDGLGDELEDCDSLAGREFSRMESMQAAGAPLKMIPEMYGFKARWDKTTNIGSFDSNPWVWVVEFKRIES